MEVVYFRQNDYLVQMIEAGFVVQMMVDPYLSVPLVDPYAVAEPLADAYQVHFHIPEEALDFEHLNILLYAVDGALNKSTVLVNHLAKKVVGHLCPEHDYQSYLLEVPVDPNFVDMEEMIQDLTLAYQDHIV